MSRSVKIAIFLLVFGFIGIVAYRFARPIINDIQQQRTSDAGATQGKITIAYDNWIGYFPLCSPEMKRQMYAAGWTLACVDDEANYEERMERLKKREIDFAVATVDSYILNAAPKDFPGVIIIVLDESKGGDAMLAWQERVNDLDALRKIPNFKIAFTPNSPSHHLLKSIADHFGLPQLLVSGERRVETNGSKEALKKLLNKEVDVAVIWEPDVSRALAKKGIIKLLGTENTERLIVDILIVDRKFSSTKPETVKLLLSTYFRVLKHYRDNRELFIKEIISETKLPRESVESMLKGVAWTNLAENSEKWFGGGITAGDIGLYNAIESTVEILVSSKDFSASPLPDKDPNRLIQSSFVKELASANLDTATAKGNPPINSLEARFSLLDETGWKSLKKVGTLKIRPVTFQSGTGMLNLQGKEEIDRIVETLKHYPNFRILVEGHTGLQGDPQANKNLSQERAESVVRYLTVTYSIDQNRVRATGRGSESPLPRNQAESDREYQYRLPRVEISLVTDAY